MCTAPKNIFLPADGVDTPDGKVSFDDIAGKFVEQFNGYRAVIASRLHSAIASYSYQIPCVGLGWSGKFDAFFDETGRPGELLRLAVDPVSRVVSTLKDTMNRQVKKDDRYVSGCWKHVRTLEKILS